MNKTDPNHFYLFDILRGLSSISVVFLHYITYFSGNCSIELLPYYKSIWILYDGSIKPVEIFYVLSGFVFFIIYGNAVSDGKIKPFKFSVIRFTRLYPLHILTLALVLIFTLFKTKFPHSELLKPDFNIKDFALNLLLIHEWGFSIKNPFNRPSGTISIEIMMYILFFISTRKFGINIFAPTFFIIVGFLFTTYIFYKYPGTTILEISIGMYCFFSGGIGYFMYKYLNKFSSLKQIFFVVIILLSSIISYYAFEYFHIPGRWFIYHGATLVSLIVFLSIIQRKEHEIGYKFKIVGDISYSVYFLHYPVSIIFIFICNITGKKQTLQIH